MKSLLVALTQSSLLHVCLGALLLFSMHFTPPPKPPQAALPTPVIEAVTIDQAALEKQVRRIQDDKKRQQLQQQQRVQELERRATEAKAKARAEAKKLSDLRKQRDSANQQAEAAKQRQRQEADKAAALEKQRQAKQAEQQQAEQAAREAQQKRLREEQKLREQERQKQAAIARAEQERVLAEQLQAEQAQRRQVRQQQVLTEVQKYQALITQTIQRNLIVDDSMAGRSCRLNIRLASNGLVISVSVLNGDPILCRAAESAVFKAVTLPVSEEPDVYQKLKDINLTVEPDL